MFGDTIKQKLPSETQGEANGLLCAMLIKLPYRREVSHNKSVCDVMAATPDKF